MKHRALVRSTRDTCPTQHEHELIRHVRDFEGPGPRPFFEARVDKLLVWICLVRPHALFFPSCPSPSLQLSSRTLQVMRIEVTVCRILQYPLDATKSSQWTSPAPRPFPQRYTAPRLSSCSLGMFPTSVFGSWLAGRPLFAALSATPLFKTETQP